MRSRTDRGAARAGPHRGLVLGCGLAVLGASGCLEAGDPWGVVVPTLTVVLRPGADRLDEGRLVTARDYRLTLETLEVSVGEVALTPAASASDFDPAHPPEGYTLCHNGHCHADDGRLVPYALVASGGEDAAPLLSWHGTSVEVPRSPLGEATAVALTGCARCDVLEPARLAAVSVELERVRVTGRAFDARVPSRLPPEGVPFDLTMPAATSIGAVDARFGPGRELGLDLMVQLAIPPSLFDDIELASATPEDGAQMAERMREDGVVLVTTARFD